MSYRKWFLSALLFIYGYKLLLLVFGAIVTQTPFFSTEIFDVFMRNDSWWYEIIAREWYPKSPPTALVQSPFPFFPLYPACIRAGYFLFHNFQVPAFLFSLLTCYFFVFFIFRYFSTLDWKPMQIFLFICFYQLFPFHYFFQVFYTEQLYITLFFAAFYFIRVRRFSGIFIACFLLTLCRPTGLVLCFSLFLWLLLEKGWKQSWTYSRLRLLMAFLGAPLALGLWMLYLHTYCGDALAFSHGMQAWERSFNYPWLAIHFRGGAESNFLSIYSLFLLGLAAIAAIRSPLNDRVFILISSIFPLSTGQTTSYYRYFGAIAPVFEKVFMLLKNRIILSACLLVLLILNLCTFYLWLATSSKLAY